MSRRRQAKASQQTIDDAIEALEIATGRLKKITKQLRDKQVKHDDVKGELQTLALIIKETNSILKIDNDITKGIMQLRLLTQEEAKNKHLLALQKTIEKADKDIIINIKGVDNGKDD